MPHWHALKRYGDSHARVKAPEGQAVNVNGYAVERGRGGQLAHRAVMAKMIGRPLEAHETVHHRNGDRLDNRPSNLELWSARQPSGQRVADKLAWANEIIAQYGDQSLIAASRRHSKPFVSLSIVIAGDQPPNEFRIFESPVVDTTKGKFTFDKKAAEDVMADYVKNGIDLMIDYDHASLDIGIDPALSGKAAGWFNIELRNGELWAVNVRWTVPAAEALRRKEWRFMSPAFSTVEGRICNLLNVAITNLPATRRLDPLMAASASGAPMNKDLVVSALDALVSGDEAKCMEILKGLIVEAASGDPDAATETDEAAPLDEPDPPETEMKVDTTPEAEKPEEIAAASARLMRLTGAKTFVDAIAVAETYRTSHLALETERQTLAAERATLESAERRKLCVELVTLGAEFPATVWADDKATTIKPRWLKMEIAELRSHVTEQRAARGGKKTTTTTAPPAVDVDAHGLTPQQLAICKEAKCDPAVFARLSKTHAPTNGGT